MELTLTKFIETYIEELEAGNFSYLYHQAKKELDRISDLTKVLWQLNIDPLESMQSVPTGYCVRMKVKDFVIPSHINAIGRNAFGMSSLKSVFIPKSVQLCESSAFIGCIDLIDVKFEAESKLRTISYHMFTGCIDLKHIELPDSVVTLDSHAFSECDSLEQVTLGPNVRFIQTNVFKDCPKLTTINYRGYSNDWKDIFIDDSAFESYADHKIIVKCLDKDIFL